MSEGGAARVNGSLVVLGGGGARGGLQHVLLVEGVASHRRRTHSVLAKRLRSFVTGGVKTPLSLGRRGGRVSSLIIGRLSLALM